jgi:hypothetical protein
MFPYIYICVNVGEYSIATLSETIEEVSAAIAVITIIQ